MADDLKPNIGGLHVGDVVEFTSECGEFTIAGKVTALHFGAYPGDYQDIALDADGMEYCFGTGGHLGSHWTTDAGLQMWFPRVLRKEGE